MSFNTNKITDLSLYDYAKPPSLKETFFMAGEKYNPQGLMSEWTLLEHYFERDWLLSESAQVHARQIIEGIWDGLKAAATYVGGKAVDAGKWALKKGKELGGKAAEVLKKIAGNMADVFSYVILKLPKGDVILDFLKNTMATLAEKIKEMGAALKEKIKEWMETAKKMIIDFFVNTVFREDENLRQDLYKALGVTEEQVDQAANEMRDLGINTITELNWALSIKGLLSESIVNPVNEQQRERENVTVGDVKDVASGAKELAGDAEDTLKVLGFMENPPSGQEGNIDPIQFMRGKAGQVVEKLFGILAKLSEQNFLKYMQPLFDSAFFNPFKTGFGLAASAFMGILSSGDLAWDKLVKYVQAITNGFKAGTKMAGKAGRAVKYLFTGEGAALLQDMVTGLVTGSNIEVIVRALSGDPTQIAEAVKRLIGAIIGGVRQAIKEYGPRIVSDAAEEEGGVGDDVEGEITDALGDFVDDMFPED